MIQSKVDRYHEQYVVRVVLEQCRYFGTLSAKIPEITSLETMKLVLWLMQEVPGEKLTLLVL